MRPLDQQAREFVGDINHLLNNTVTDGVRLSTLLHRPDSCLAGLGIGKRQTKPGIISVTPGRRKPTVWLRVGFVLKLDDAGRFLTVTKSGFTVYADAAGALTLFHYDYERDPDNDYPNPHVQVEGDSPALASVCARVPEATALLRDVHFPVGGRRFRPTLEDIIELLVAECLAEPRPGWRDAVEHHRQAWREAQVKAAVRRFPQWACETLTSLGYAVSAPPEDRR